MRTLTALSLLVGTAIVTVLAATEPRLVADREFDAALGRIADAVLSGDGRLLAVAGERGYGVWDVQTAAPIRKDAVAGGSIQRVRFDPRATLLALGGEDGRVSVVDLRSGAIKEVARSPKEISALAFGPDGRIGVSGDVNGTLTVWNADGGTTEKLDDPGNKKGMLALAFSGSSLLSVNSDLRIVTWDVTSKRALRRGTLQSEVAGRTIRGAELAVDPSGERVLVAAQIISEPRGGVLATRGSMARPDDLKRENILIGYNTSTGISSDPSSTAEFAAEHLAIGPAKCLGVFSSFTRRQASLHVWGLSREGQSLVKLDLPERIAAVALASAGQLAVAVSETGHVRTWRVSGATAEDCIEARQTSGPQFTLGSETGPLITAGNGDRLAVLRFDTAGLDAGLGESVAQMISGELSNSPQVTVIERGAVDKILEELKLQRSGLTTSDAVKIGQGLNARKVLLGGISRFGESTYVVQTRIVDVATQQVQGSRQVTCETCREQDLPRAIGVLRRAIVP